MDTDLVCGLAMGVRINLVDVSLSFHPQWMQDCMSNTLSDLLKVLYDDGIFENYYSVTGVAFPTNGVLVYLPSNETQQSVIHGSTTYITTCIASVAAQLFTINARNLEGLFTGSTDEFNSLFSKPIMMAVRLFMFDQENPLQDAYEYLQFIYNNEEIVDSSSSDEEDEHPYEEEDHLSGCDDEPANWPLSFLCSRPKEFDHVEEEEDTTRLWHVVKQHDDGTFKIVLTRYLAATICCPRALPSSNLRKSPAAGEVDTVVTLIGKTTSNE
jgi:hypothetical protein